MNVMNYGKCGDLWVKWEYSKLHGCVYKFESWVWQQWNAPPARIHADNFRQDLQDGQDLNVGLCHPVHYACVPPACFCCTEPAAVQVQSRLQAGTKPDA